MLSESQFTKLGLALWQTQLVEFFYKALCSQLEKNAGQSKIQSRNSFSLSDVLDPHKYRENKGTLGQLHKDFEGILGVYEKDFLCFLDARNLIVHRFSNAVITIQNYTEVPDPDKYLEGFIEQSNFILDKMKLVHSVLQIFENKYINDGTGRFNIKKGESLTTEESQIMTAYKNISKNVTQTIS